MLSLVSFPLIFFFSHLSLSIQSKYGLSTVKYAFTLKLITPLKVVVWQ